MKSNIQRSKVLVVIGLALVVALAGQPVVLGQDGPPVDVTPTQTPAPVTDSSVPADSNVTTSDASQGYPGPAPEFVPQDPSIPVQVSPVQSSNNVVALDAGSYQPPLAARPGTLIDTRAVSLNAQGKPVLTRLHSTIPGFTSSISTRVLATPLALNPTAAPFEGPAASGPLVDQWARLLSETFEGPLQTTCKSTNGNGQIAGAYRWGTNMYRNNTPNGNTSIWPASWGTTPKTAGIDNYPSNFQSWYLCGPYDISGVRSLIVRFDAYKDTLGTGDQIRYGYSVDGTNFQFETLTLATGWQTIERRYGSALSGNTRIYFAWAFISNSDTSVGKGVWLDNLEAYRYFLPGQVCGQSDPGYKGLVMDPYDPSSPNGDAPLIRYGENRALDNIDYLDADWVRVVFQLKHLNAVDLIEYDRMIDSLCARGISVLGVINNQTIADSLALVQQNPGTYLAPYSANLSNTAKDLARHYAERISAWEIWNEPNFDEDDDPVAISGPFLQPPSFAKILIDVSAAVRSQIPGARIVAGGLGSAKNDSRDYLNQTYSFLGAARPFNSLGLHPYPTTLTTADPSVYMTDGAHMGPGDVTIIDKFVKALDGNGDSTKTIWVTEVGFNSARFDPAVDACIEPVTEGYGQARFLSFAFTTLLANPRVNKVMWYQYMDLTREKKCGQATLVKPHFFGLYSVRSASGFEVEKLAGCTFRLFPLFCTYSYIPSTVKRYVPPGGTLDQPSAYPGP